MYACPSRTHGQATAYSNLVLDPLVPPLSTTVDLRLHLRVIKDCLVQRNH